MPNGPQNPDFDYIVVGSGAGVGPVACNLAKAGYRVGLIEAGQEPDTTTYPVPVFQRSNLAAPPPAGYGAGAGPTPSAG